MTKTVVIVKLGVDGMHNFPEAGILFPEVGFLASPHRHIFHITLACRVTHSDRDKEFIMLKRDVQEYLKNKYYDETIRSHQFNRMSCEEIAQELLDKFNADWVEVFEDNENGARIDCID